MSKLRLELTDPAEAAVVEQIEVRLVRPEEQARWEELMVEHHYLKNGRMVGEQLRYVAEYQGQWLALLGWSAASYHLKGRDGMIGWSDNQRRGRLHLVANNARFCRLPEAGPYPNLASRAMILNLERLSADWLSEYGHPIVLVESFVDLELFRGSAYKASGWKAIGTTAGFKRVGQDFYEVHQRPKQLFVRELSKHAARGLRRRQLPEAWGAQERAVERGCSLDAEQLLSLWKVLHQQVPESRDGQGLRHRQATVLAITFAFLLSGGQGGYRAVTLFAQDLKPTFRARLRCWFNARTRRYEVPSENCFYRVLKAVPVMAFQQALWAWQNARLGPGDGDVVVVDGKALRGSGRTQLVGAINAGSGRTLGVEAVADKSNEIPAGQTLLDRLELDGTIVLMDALHTQVKTAQGIVQEGGGDYVLVVKGNQGDLQKQASHFLPEVFCPQYQTVDNGHGRIEWRGIEVKEITPEQMGFPHVAQVARIDRIRELKNGRQEVETIWIITSLTAEQADPARLLELVRQYWCIENGTHYRLDVSAGEDRCPVRQPIAATVLGLLRRAVQGESRAWMRRQPRARDRTCPTFFAKMSYRLGQVIRLIACPAA